ncbi:MAG: hypothetical protein H0T73_20395 [Ardenticatenales bacterium]|nr:hypothetical protein [Ardenticatenales bacterium]
MSQEKPLMGRALLIGTILGLLLSAALVGLTSDWSWLAFTMTLGWALGLGIGVHSLRENKEQ